MLALIVFFAIMFGILSFRIYRTVHYYKEARNNPDHEEKDVARTNFIIHLIFCVLLSIIIVVAFYWFVLAADGEV